MSDVSSGLLKLIQSDSDNDITMQLLDTQPGLQDVLLFWAVANGIVGFNVSLDHFEDDFTGQMTQPTAS